VERIGVLDLRFFGYFGDVDYGMRAQLAGFKLACAKGAWLFHVGGGHVKREAEKDGTLDDRVRERMALVETAYQAFRQKWDIAAPESYPANPKQIPLRAIAEAARDRIPLRYELPAGLIQDGVEFH
jgi:hypothetical protein